MIEFIRKRVPHGGFTHNILIMMSGTVVGQVVSLAMGPILTRVYTPSDYGLFALYVSVTAIPAIIATGRYDNAVLLADNESDTASLVALSVGLTAVVSLLSLVVLLIFNQTASRWLGTPEVAPLLYLVPLTILASGVYQTLYLLANRKKEFKRLAFNRAMVSTVAAVLSLALGLMGMRAWGLVVATLTSQVTGCAMLGWRLFTANDANTGVIRLGAMIEQARRHYRFPLFILPSDLVNAVGQQAPSVLLNKFFGTATLGYYALTQTVLGCPMSLVAGSIVDVFKERAASEFRTNGHCRQAFAGAFRVLALLAVPLAIVFFVFGPALFTFVFGSEWRTAGTYARWLAPLFCVRMLSSPLSYVLYVARKQGVDLLAQVLMLICCLGSLYIGHRTGSVMVGVVGLSASLSVIYILYLGVSFRTAAGRKTS